MPALKSHLPGLLDDVRFVAVVVVVVAVVDDGARTPQLSVCPSEFDWVAFCDRHTCHTLLMLMADQQNAEPQ